MLEYLNLLTDTEKLIHYGGLSILLIIITIETGFFFGFFLPGDPLLFTAGLLCGTKDLDVNLFILLISVTIAAFIGNVIGYSTGKYVGKKLFTKTNSIFFKQQHLETTRNFYNKYGGLSLVTGRFLPIVRTFAPIFAGIIEIPFWKFNGYNILGAFLWVWTLIPLGYFLGNQFPQLIEYIEYIIIGIVILTSIILIKAYHQLKPKTS